MSGRTLRRSFALPAQVVEDAIAQAPAELKNNLNRLVTVALQAYISRRKEQEFDEAMYEMAKDPAIVRESKAMTSLFHAADADGLVS